MVTDGPARARAAPRRRRGAKRGGGRPVRPRLPDRVELVTPPASQPVFVVGGPRSGTTLLSAMLASHSAFDCGPETHFPVALVAAAPTGARPNPGPGRLAQASHRLRHELDPRQGAGPPHVRPHRRRRPRVAARPAALAGDHAGVADGAACPPPRRRPVGGEDAAPSGGAGAHRRDLAGSPHRAHRARPARRRRVTREGALRDAVALDQPLRARAHERGGRRVLSPIAPRP